MYIDNHNYDPYYPGYKGSIPSIFFRGIFHDWAPRTGNPDKMGTYGDYIRHDLLKQICRDMNTRYHAITKKG